MTARTRPDPGRLVWAYGLLREYLPDCVGWLHVVDEVVGLGSVAGQWLVVRRAEHLAVVLWRG